MDNITSLLVGIASSLVATAIFLAAAEVFRRIVVPWYSDAIYRGVRVSGTWRAIGLGMADEAALRERNSFATLTLVQRGNSVTGTFVHKSPSTDHTDASVYKVAGQLRDMHLMITMEPASNDSIDALSCLLYVRNPRR